MAADIAAVVAVVAAVVAEVVTSPDVPSPTSCIIGNVTVAATVVVGGGGGDGADLTGVVVGVGGAVVTADEADRLIGLIGDGGASGTKAADDVDERIARAGGRSNKILFGGRDIWQRGICILHHIGGEAVNERASQANNGILHNAL